MKKLIILRCLGLVMLFSCITNCLFGQSITFKELTIYLDKELSESVQFFAEKGFTQKSGGNEFITLYKNLGKPGTETICITTLNKKDGSNHSAIIYNLNSQDRVLNLMKQMPNNMHQTCSNPGSPKSTYCYETASFMIDITLCTYPEEENGIMLVSKRNK